MLLSCLIASVSLTYFPHRSLSPSLSLSLSFCSRSAFQQPHTDWLYLFSNVGPALQWNGGWRWSPVFHFALHLHVASCSASSAPQSHLPPFVFTPAGMLKTTPCYLSTHPPSTFKASYKKTNKQRHLLHNQSSSLQKSKETQHDVFLAPRSHSVEGFLLVSSRCSCCRFQCVHNPDPELHTRSHTHTQKTHKRSIGMVPINCVEECSLKPAEAFFSSSL